MVGRSFGKLGNKQGLFRLTDTTGDDYYDKVEQMFYAYHLRSVKGGWSTKDLTAYFTWIGRAEANRGDSAKKKSWIC